MEALLRKVERQFLDVTEKSKHDFKVKTGDGEAGLEEFLKNFRWDEAKFSRTNQLSEVIKSLTQVIRGKRVVGRRREDAGVREEGRKEGRRR